ncbi:type IV secretion system DNA-binding domain-containing protein [Patescibacteria group bacterium]|nr:type IV secretion system DNA-binding domain-containing protein [Patescibacteria group bacterium]MBU4512798.1 type IV secretion system DNA-binding domain-containing protein [Patescibacteria group bacterium]
MPTDNDQNLTLLAETNFRNRRVKFGIKEDDRRRHMYLIGKTGMGKTTVIENMIIQDIRAGNGVALVDPHGDIADKILDYIPSNRVNDVVYFNPADLDFPVAFNVLEQVDASHRHLVSSGLVGVFKKIWADSWGPRLEYVLRNAILALLEYPGSSLLGIMRLLVDKAYRKKVISKVTDPVVRSFWVDEYSKYPDRFQSEAIAPIQNKVGQFLSTFLIRNIVGQVKSKLDMREIMDTKKIFIMNLAKGRVGEDSSALLGAIMITKVQLAAMSRVDIPEEERKDFYLYVDEFQNFATESFANILSEARKYRLDLIIAHQYIEQLDETVQAAVFGNVGTIMCFRIGAADAEAVVKEFEPEFTETDLVNLAKFDVYMKLMIDGVSSAPFSAGTLPPLAADIQEGNREKIIKISRERYAEPRKEVEEKINRWSGMMDEGRENGVGEGDGGGAGKKVGFRPTGSAGRDTSPKFEATCSHCGEKTDLPFKPDPARPVYCRECLQKVRSGEVKPARAPRRPSGSAQPQPSAGPEPVTKKVPEEVSLKDAMSQGTVAFDGKKKNKNDDQNDR